MKMKDMMSSRIEIGMIIRVLILEMFAFCMAKGGNITTIDWILQETSYTRLCSTKDILTVNGEFPGPALELSKGETIYVNVHNQGTYNVTIHWHGVKQPRNPWSDGPEYITQCPINPGANFTYEIILSEEEGTLWWHAHSDWTRATVHGPIIIKPRNGTTYPFANPAAEISIVLSSWFKGDVMKIITDALATGGPPSIADAFTINGQPGDTQSCSSQSMTKFEVDQGKTYLLRVINAVLEEELFFAIANHTLTVVGIDASYIKPIKTSYIMITPGQTMDILLTTNQSPSHYYMAARAYAQFAFCNATTTAIISYSGNYTAPSSPPLPDLPSYTDTDAVTAFTNQFRALASKNYSIDVPQSVDKRIVMTISINTLPCDLKNGTCAGFYGDRDAASMNNISFVNPSIDILQAYYKSIKGVFTTDFPVKPEEVFNYTMDPMLGNRYTMASNGTKVTVLDYNTTVEIVFQGTNVLNGSDNHPIHLHGYSFYNVGSGFGNFDESSDPSGYNLVDPPLINTVGVPKNGWSAIRFKASNPGVWFMHCHLEVHVSWGMATVLIVKNGPTTATSLRKPTYINPC
ncbi:hypothetical protein Dimus_033988 [Dionaea muscipula]